VVLVLANLASAPVSWFDEGVTPSWVAYPLVLLGGLYRLRAGGRRGTLWIGIAALVFLLVHLPFTYAALFGDEHPVDAEREYSPLQWFITLFLIPLATVVASWVARREAVPRSRTSSNESSNERV
jgi:hypothetical protein